MHDTADEQLSPIRPSLYQRKIIVVGSGFEAIAGAPHRGWEEDSISVPIPRSSAAYNIPAGTI